MTVQEEIQDANIQDAIHCVKVELEEEVCEECRFHRLCHIWCKDVSRIKLEALEKQIPSEEKPIMRDSLGRCKMRGCNLCDGYREELEQYRALGTVEELKEAREKQIPKKPKEYEDRYYACECGNILLPKWKKYPTELMPKSEGLPHCMSCGQKIDWGEEE